MNRKLKAWLKEKGETLTDQEYEFFLIMQSRPGCKLNSGELGDDPYNNDPSKKLEYLELIDCVGSYKWVPSLTAIEILHTPESALDRIDQLYSYNEYVLNLTKFVRIKLQQKTE